MYNLHHFKVKDPLRILAFMREHPFAMLCGADKDGRPVATQVPLFIDMRDGELVLSGHIMRNTDHHLAFGENPKALALFTGPHAYVSASWYTQPEQASTWNYMTVYARGQMKFLGNDELVSILQRTTDHFEGGTDTPGSFNKLDPEYVQKLSTAIVAFEIVVEEMDHVFKLSQNRDDASHENIIDHLSEGDDLARAVAEAMKKTR